MPKKAKTTAETAPEALQILWQEGFFKIWNSTDKISTHLFERGNNFRPDALRMALVRARHLIYRKQNGVLEFIQTKPAVSKEIDKIENELFDDGLINKFGNNFKTELADLQFNFGRSGTCTAFLLRKILEKLLFLAFVKNGALTKIEDKNTAGRIVGLEALINTAAREKINGIPFLTGGL